MRACLDQNKIAKSMVEILYKYIGIKFLQVTQNYCIWFCLKRNSKRHMGTEEFIEIKWLPTKESVKQCFVKTTWNKIKSQKVRWKILYKYIGSKLIQVTQN